jgi:DNA replication factor GINS
MNRDELYRIWKAEKTDKTFQKLPSSFYSEVSRLVTDSKAASDSIGQDETQKAISEKELKILQRLGTEIAETRMKKIVDSALSRQEVQIGMLASEEAEFAKLIATHMGQYYGFIDELAQGGVEIAKPSSKPVEVRLEVVRFLSDFPAIIGVDLKTYGPFKAEDIGTLPSENASALINQGVVKQVQYTEGLASVSVE